MEPEREPPALREEARAWDRWLGEFRVAPAERDPHAAARASAVLGEVERLRLPRDGARFLEVGCGDGYDSVALSRLGDVTATDLAPDTIAEATRRYGPSGVEFVAGDFLALSFRGAPFDAIVTIETIAHVQDQAGFVRRCAELLRPGGHLVVTTQNRALYEHLGFGPPQGYTRRWLDRGELRRLLALAFEVRRVYTIASADPGTLRPSAEGHPAPLPLRLAYSYRLDRLAGRVVPARWRARARERAGLGRTLVAVARRR